MFTKKYYTLFILISLTLSLYGEKVDLGDWNKEEFQALLKSNDATYISKQFLGKPYKAHALIGDIDTNEEFVINLSGVDCFTYIDYIEAMRTSNNFDAFKAALQSIRYQDAHVAFTKRNHFFSDWAIYNEMVDITQTIGKEKTKTVIKQLNKKDPDTLYLPGIPIVERTITYIPTKSITNAMLSRLQSGDYAGIYIDKIGLDVSHVGIIIKESDKTYFRHASSSKKNRKVVTVMLMEYLKSKPGLVILRPKK
jgi:hypothetical protein